ncbi:MAG TPA: HXXEE domain-containing protein [Vicinamibacterales bacterium]|nr:HXXEE domain-containing protein [Vicinamibacterales bacterium]
MSYWLPLIVFIPHMIEEYPRFPAWATRHFGATSKAWYVYSHIVLVAIAATVCLWAGNASSQGWGRIVGTALMITLAMNGVFHVVTTFRFREYSPGVVTGTILFFPATGYMLLLTVRESLLMTPQIGTAVVIGVVVQVAVVASLYLRMDIDWRFQRAQRSAAAKAAAQRGLSTKRSANRRP